MRESPSRRCASLSPSRSSSSARPASLGRTAQTGRPEIGDGARPKQKRGRFAELTSLFPPRPRSLGLQASAGMRTGCQAGVACPLSPSGEPTRRYSPPPSARPTPTPTSPLQHHAGCGRRVVGRQIVAATRRRAGRPPGARVVGARASRRPSFGAGESSQSPAPSAESSGHESEALDPWAWRKERGEGMLGWMDRPSRLPSGLSEAIPC